MTDTPQDRMADEAHRFPDDVLTADEMRRALRLSERQWSRVAPLLPVSYLLGKQSPRYIYGEVLAVLRKSGAAAA